MASRRSVLIRRLAQNEHVARLGRRLMDALEIEDLDALASPRPALAAEDRAAADIVRGLRIARSSRARTVAAPLSERLFDEVLVLVPFLRWAVRSNSLDPKRLVALTHPGAGHWYARLAGDVVERLDDDTEAPEPGWLGPLRELGAATSNGSLPPRTLFRFLAHEQLPPRRDSGQLSGPKSIAVSVGFPPGFPDTRENRALLERTLERLDKAVATIAVEEPAQSEPETETPGSSQAALRRTALDSRFEAIDAAVAGADTVVGPLCCDAIALGLVYGRACLGIASQESTSPDLVDFMLRVARRLGSPLSILEPSDLELVARLLPFHEPLGPRGSSPARESPPPS